MVEAAVVDLNRRVGETVPPLFHVKAAEEAARRARLTIDARGALITLRGQRIPEVRINARVALGQTSPTRGHRRDAR